MTDSPSDPETSPAPAVEPAVDTTAALAATVAAAVGGTVAQSDFATAKVAVERDDWVAALTAARDDVGLDFFSWLSAIDWSRETTLGEGVEDAEGTVERFEVLCTLSTTSDARRVIFTVDLPKDDAALPSVSSVFGGAEWHERETAEMFGIDFVGHPHLIKLYLPSEFEGFPLLKSFPLLSREVKPWPGKVDVEGMPGTENPEAPPVGEGDE